MEFAAKLRIALQAKIDKHRERFKTMYDWDSDRKDIIIDRATIAALEEVVEAIDTAFNQLLGR